MRTFTAALAAGALTVSMGGLLAGCGGTDESPTAATPAPTRTEVPATPSDPATTPADDASASSGAATTVPVYWVGDTPSGPRLFREFRRVTGDPLQAAADLVTSGTPLDPDYRTLFPGGTFSSVAVQDGVIVATAADRTFQTPGDLSEAEGALGAQQLVYTLQGVVQQRLPVEVVVDGQPDFLLGVDTDGGITQAPPLKTLALVNVTSPEQGSTVSGTLKASGVASSFEANVPWRILDAGGKVVLDGAATAEGYMNRLYPWSTDIDVSSLSPGDYVFEARTDDPSDGEGAGPTVDTKAFTVS